MITVELVAKKLVVVLFVDDELVPPTAEPFQKSEPLLL